MVTRLTTKPTVGEPVSLLDFVCGIEDHEAEVRKLIVSEDIPVFVRVFGEYVETCQITGEYPNQIPDKKYDKEHVVAISRGGLDYFVLFPEQRRVLMSCGHQVELKKFPALILSASQEKRRRELAREPELSVLSDPERVGHFWLKRSIAVEVIDLYIFPEDAGTLRSLIDEARKFDGDGMGYEKSAPPSHAYVPRRSDLVDNFLPYLLDIFVNSPSLFVFKGRRLNRKVLTSEVCDKMGMTKASDVENIHKYLLNGPKAVYGATSMVDRAEQILVDYLDPSKASSEDLLAAMRKDFLKEIEMFSIDLK
jgi:hypothetical protein